MTNDATKCLMTYCKANDWTVERTAGGHLKLTHPKVSGSVTAPSTPSCSRASFHARAMLLRKLRASDGEAGTPQTGPLADVAKTTNEMRRRRKRDAQLALIGYEPAGSFKAFSTRVPL